jgi:hypothetical protein
MSAAAVVSVGPACPCAFLLKLSGVKHASHPFDWVISSPEMVRDCLATDFADFLDPAQAYHDEARAYDPAAPYAHHVKYGVNTFHHHDPAVPDHHAYFSRCVTRFRALRDAPPAAFFYLDMGGRPQGTEDEFADEMRRLKAALDAYLGLGPGGPPLVAVRALESAQRRMCRLALDDAAAGVTVVEFHMAGRNVGVRSSDPLDTEALESVVRWFAPANPAPPPPTEECVWPYSVWAAARRRTPQGCCLCCGQGRA